MFCPRFFVVENLKAFWWCLKKQQKWMADRNFCGRKANQAEAKTFNVWWNIWQKFLTQTFNIFWDVWKFKTKLKWSFQMNHETQKAWKGYWYFLQFLMKYLSLGNGLLGSNADHRGGWDLVDKPSTCSLITIFLNLEGFLDKFYCFLDFEGFSF